MRDLWLRRFVQGRAVWPRPILHEKMLRYLDVKIGRRCGHTRSNVEMVWSGHHFYANRSCAILAGGHRIQEL